MSRDYFALASNFRATRSLLIWHHLVYFYFYNSHRLQQAPADPDMGEVPTRSHSSDPVFHDEMQAPGEMREIRNNMAPMRLTYDKEESAPNLAWTDAQPGEYCLVQREAEDSSPAIICDEELVQAHEAESGGQRPKNAKKPDGDWPAKYRERGSHAGERMFLVLFLDKLTL